MVSEMDIDVDNLASSQVRFQLGIYLVREANWGHKPFLLAAAREVNVCFR